jgi:hypothetical protein
MEVNTEYHAPAPLPQGKSHKHILGKRLCGSQRWSGQAGKEEVLVLLEVEHHPPAKSSHCTDRTPILEAEAGQRLIKTGKKL